MFFGDKSIKKDKLNMFLGVILEKKIKRRQNLLKSIYKTAKLYMGKVRKRKRYVISGKNEENRENEKVIMIGKWVQAKKDKKTHTKMREN